LSWEDTTDLSDNMNILLLGPQGSGKGTQARLLCEKFGFFYFESGAFLRDAGKTNEHLAQMLKNGVFVPDAEMSSYVASYLDEKGVYDNILFDGFPRSIIQYDSLKVWLTAKKVKIDIVFLLTIPQKETIRRLSARRTDSATGKIYNLVTDPPPESIDPNTLTQRDDDKPEAIKKRLGWYEEQVTPLVAALREDIGVIDINGMRPIGEIQKELAEIIEKQK
jgi:adenylate kinase